MENIQNKFTLLIPDKPDKERDAVAKEWSSIFGDVFRIGKFWEPPVIESKNIKLYGNDTFCLVLEQKFNLKLISPDDKFIERIEWKWLKRDIEITTIDKVNLFPSFIKPVIPKQFKAKVYVDKNELLLECKGLSLNTEIIKSDIIEIVAEARSFILDNEVLDCSIYDGQANLFDAEKFTCNFCHENILPKTCVIDVGLTNNNSWVFVESNATWGAGLNGCDAKKVIKAIYYATSYSEN
jgi:hypothetical protein